MMQGLGDGKGELRTNDYTTYDIAGKIVLESNKPINYKMTLHIPANFPQTELSMSCIGTTSDIPLINNMGVTNKCPKLSCS
jgi:hypothetical protein